MIRIQASELQRVEGLARRIWPACFQIFLTDQQIVAMLDSIYAPNALAAEIQQGHCFWIAQIGGKDVGFASAYVSGDTMWLKKLYILPDKQGKGIGRGLIHTAINHFSSAKTIALYVNEHNAPAIAKYERMGFAIDHREPVKMGPFDFIDCVMRKNIAD